EKGRIAVNGGVTNKANAEDKVFLPHRHVVRGGKSRICVRFRMLLLRQLRCQTCRFHMCLMRFKLVRTCKARARVYEPVEPRVKVDRLLCQSALWLNYFSRFDIQISMYLIQFAPIRKNRALR